MSTQNVRIEQFTLDAYDEVLALWRRCEGIGLSDADTRESIGGYLARNPGMSFVAKAEGRVIGAVLAGHDGRRGFIHHLAVLPEFRGRGLGRKLTDSALDALRHAGIRKCHLFVMASNADGTAFWEATGWERRRDIVVMSRRIP